MNVSLVCLVIQVGDTKALYKSEIDFVTEIIVNERGLNNPQLWALTGIKDKRAIGHSPRMLVTN